MYKVLLIHSTPNAVYKATEISCKMLQRWLSLHKIFLHDNWHIRFLRFRKCRDPAVTLFSSYTLAKCITWQMHSVVAETQLLFICVSNSDFTQWKHANVNIKKKILSYLDLLTFRSYVVCVKHKNVNLHVRIDCYKGKRHSSILV